MYQTKGDANTRPSEVSAYDVLIVPKGTTEVPIQGLERFEVTSLSELAKAFQSEEIPVVSFDDISMLSSFLRDHAMWKRVPAVLEAAPGGDYSHQFEQAVYGFDKLSYDIMALDERNKGRMEKISKAPNESQANRANIEEIATRSGRRGAPALPSGDANSFFSSDEE